MVVCMVWVDVSRLQTLPEIFPELGTAPPQRLHQQPVGSAKLAGRPALPKAAVSVHSASHVDVVRAAVQSVAPTMSKSQVELPPAKAKQSTAPPVAVKPPVDIPSQPTRTLALLSSAVGPVSVETTQVCL